MSDIDRDEQIDQAAFRVQFERRRPFYAALVAEAKHVLSESFKEHPELKIHDINDRVKTFESALQKCLDKGIKEPFTELIDIAGIRVICLLRKDIDNIDKVIRAEFNVIKVDNKIFDSENDFGYMSIHYDVKLHASSKGRRYDHIKDIVFEIQVRTIGMHAWASVSHFLQYKGAWDVPMQYRKTLNALSGLFFVADSQFEQFFLAREAARNEPVDVSLDQPIDFDSLRALLAELLPSRRVVSGGAGLSRLVRNAKKAGYTNIADIRRDLVKGRAAAEQYELSRAAAGTYSAEIFARAALSIVSEPFLESRGITDDASARYRKFRSRVLS